ncbi:glutathione S-transferase 1-like [Malaya genurostris]|uniref:glutathione S-transferase 1-like n=1 Tax=Malaya genurostris TaxID=325434 RepID=UPI0026F3EA18|nr:glutathione S-transferase 1-like [Malaya genurostris]
MLAQSTSVASELKSHIISPVEFLLNSQPDGPEEDHTGSWTSIMDLYYMPLSAPCQSVRLLAKAMNLHLNLAYLDLFKEEHMKPEFLKINPQHVIPTLVDNDFVLWESRAILIYLCEKYGKGDAWYPRDPKKRAIVNQRLYFDMGTLYQRFSQHYYPVIFEGKQFSDETAQRMEEGFGFLETYLDGSVYVAGDSLTIADLPILATITTIKLAAGLDLAKYPNIQRWYAQMSTEVAGHDEICVRGAQEFAPFFSSARKSLDP